MDDEPASAVRGLAHQVDEAPDGALARVRAIDGTELVWEDIMYELYVKQKIEAGLRAAEEGGTIAHEEMKRRISAKKRHGRR